MCGVKWKVLQQVSKDYGIDFEELCTRYNVSKPVSARGKQKQTSQDYIEMEEYQCGNTTYLVDSKKNAYLHDDATGFVHYIGNVQSNGVVHLIGCAT